MPRPPLILNEHLNRQIPPMAHTPMYIWHKYWSRKTWNVVGEFVEHYTNPGEVILDPFSGSGVVAIEAARRGRRAIAIDLNPAACLITELTLKPVDSAALRLAFQHISDSIKTSVESLYLCRCTQCGHKITADAFVRVGNELTEVRYQRCRFCGHRCIGEAPVLADIEELTALESMPISDWYPTTRFEYSDGTPFKKREHFESVDQLFTKRNLRALAMIHAEIQKERRPALRKFLLGAFTSALHLSTRMMPVGTPQPTNHYTFFSSPGWTHHSYWSAPRYMEQNAWDKFESAVIGPQGILRAKEESSATFPSLRITGDWKKVFAGEADIAIVNGDCLREMARMPEECIDYVFTDPPYADSIQYGELSLMWNAWLRKDNNYSDRLIESEVVSNDRQHKPFDVYHRLLSNCFSNIFRVVAPGRYVTLTFHNPAFKVRNATVRAGVYAGFEYQKIHHQPLAQVSAQSMMQPFGSAQGDFYLRFYKPLSGSVGYSLEEVTDERFRNIVIETCKEVIAERAEPTPYTILINYIDPVLAKNGLFGVLNTGLDVKTVLEEALATDFELTDAKIGSASGKLWWFKDPVFAARIRTVPLSERVEKTVENTLREKGRVTFTEVWDAVSREFPNSLTQDSLSIKDALERYARTVGTQYWLLREEVSSRIRAHSEIIAVLAMLGRAKGYDIWIGSPEQATTGDGLGGGVQLRNLVTVRPRSLDGVTNLRDVLLMDLLWLEGERVITAFEVESTTTMTSGLQRGSNLPLDVKKIMVLPEERKIDFERKMQSPLFRAAYEGHNWSLLYFDQLRQTYSEVRDQVDLDAIIGIEASPRSITPRGRARTMNLFE